MPLPSTATLAGEWAQGVILQQKPLDRARWVSKLTVPSIVPPEGVEPGADFPDPFTSVGARGLNNLSSRILLSQLPSQASWFTWEVSTRGLLQVSGVDPDQIDQIPQEEVDKAVQDAKLALTNREKAVLRWISTHGVVSRAFEFFRHLLVAGTSVMRLYRTGKAPRNYRLPHFQVLRDPDGTWTRLITREYVRPSSFDPNVQMLLRLDAAAKPEAVYTVVQRQGSGPKWETWQEAKQTVLPGSYAEFEDEDDVPWIVSRFGAPPDEDYGRSFGEEALGDLRSAEGLTQALIEGAAMLAECKWAIRADAGITPLQFQSLPNGAPFAGDADKIKAVRSEKAPDFGFAAGVLERIEQRLGLSFLLHTAATRDAERVTAEEIRANIQELEQALGGGFSVLALEFQEPLARKVDRILVRMGELDALPKGVADIRVVTGVEALGRSQDRIRIRAFNDDLVALFGPDGAAQRLQGNEVTKELALANGVPLSLVLTDDELAAQAEQQQQQAALQVAGPEIAKLLKELIAQQTQAPQQ